MRRRSSRSDAAGERESRVHTQKAPKLQPHPSLRILYRVHQLGMPIHWGTMQILAIFLRRRMRWVLEVHPQFVSKTDLFCSCSEDGCDYMGMYAFSKYKGAPAPRNQRLYYLMTSASRPFCAYHHRVTIVLSDTPASKEQGGDRGSFWMVLNGENNSSELIKLNRQDAYFEPGRTYNFMTITQNLGHVHSADLIWQYTYHPFNPLTWRVTSVSTLYINRYEFCLYRVAFPNF